MSSVKPRGKVPKKASIDEVIEIKTLIRHPMHSGRMKDKDGKILIPEKDDAFNLLFNNILSAKDDEYRNARMKFIPKLSCLSCTLNFGVIETGTNIT